MLADSLCCTVETNTALWSNYTPIKMKKKCKEFYFFFFLKNYDMVNNAYKTWFKPFSNQASHCNNSVWKSATYMSPAAVLSAACGYAVKLHWLKQQEYLLTGWNILERGRWHVWAIKSQKLKGDGQKKVLWWERRDMTLDFYDLLMFHFL